MKMLDLFKKKNRVKEVEEYYRKWTEKYIDSFGDTFQAHQPKDLDAYYSYLVKSIDIKPGYMLLDAGCGVGGPMLGMAKILEAKFHGVNISGVQVEKCATKIIENNLKNVSVSEGDFHKLSKQFPPNSMDRVFFLESLVHSYNIDLVIKEVKKILKPYGKIYIKDLFEKVAIDSDDKMKIKRSLLINNDLFKMTILSKEKVLNILRDNGFKLDFCKLLDIEANQDLGNGFVIDNNIVTHESDWHPYLEWYEIRATKIMSPFD